jgi:glycosyltransferase involved in cell wall biosynthesis
MSVVTACYNEEQNVREMWERVSKVMAGLSGYDYEHIFIDNASQDRTVAILEEIARGDRKVKVIVNARNFGHVRSPCHAILQARGDAVVSVAADGQEPPELIPEFVSRWEEGYPVVMGVKTRSEESSLMFGLRRAYYRLLRRLSDVELVENFTGFGLYDRQVVEAIRSLNDPYPYLRGLIPELGFDSAKVAFVQPLRTGGRTKNNFYTLMDMALLGMTSYSKVPLRLATMLGFCSAAVSLLVAAFYFVYKLLFWNKFSAGLAPLVVGIFFFCSVLLFFLGIVGEYVGSIHTYARRMPLVVEKRRINF